MLRPYTLYALLAQSSLKDGKNETERACECVLNLTFPEVPPTTPADCHSEMAGPLNGRTGGSAVLRSIPMSVLDNF